MPTRLPEGCHPGRHCLECRLPQDTCPDTSCLSEETEMLKFAELWEITGPKRVGEKASADKIRYYSRPEALRMARTGKGISLRQLSEDVHTTQYILGSAEKKIRGVSDAVAARCAEILERSIEDLYTIVVVKGE